MSVDLGHIPETFKLTKSQVLEIIDRRIIEWKKSWKENYQYILEAYAVKLLIKKSDEAKFSHFWMVLIKDIDAVRYENEKMASDFSHALKDLESGSGTDFEIDISKVIKNSMQH